MRLIVDMRRSGVNGKMRVFERVRFTQNFGCCRLFEGTFEACQSW